MVRNLVESAKTRARIIALLNEVPPQPRSMSELVTELGIKPANEKAFTSLVYRMAGNELISGIHMEQGKLYGPRDWHPDTEDVPKTNHYLKQKPARLYKRQDKDKDKDTAKVLNMLADLTVDISKSTGRIRLTTNGLTIDIGIIA